VGKKFYGSSQNVESSCWRAGAGENTGFVCGDHCAENADSLGCPTTVKQMKLWIE